MQYFGSYNVEDVAKSWVDAEIRWVEVDARFRNTHSYTDIRLVLL